MNDQHRNVTLRSSALEIVRESDPLKKAALARIVDVQGLPVGAGDKFPPQSGLPGRPSAPALIPARDMPRLPTQTIEGRASLIHSIAHIELNAIDLAADIVWRFDSMPNQFYRDWMRIAGEEALHFTLLRDHLTTLGYDYGSFPAHNSLWDMAERTSNDILARIGLLPRTLEARGLDASPAVKKRLVGAGDVRAGEILDVILADEVGHVAAGNHWYRWLCAARSLDPVATYADLTHRYKAPRLLGPFNIEARKAAGFTDEELEALAATATRTSSEA